MILSLSAYFFKAKSEDQKIINALSVAFYNNSRVQTLIGAKSPNFSAALKTLLAFCYFMVKKLGGIFSSKDKTTFLLFYRKSEHYFSFRDVFRYLHLAFFVVGIRRLKMVLRREQLIRRTRAKKIQEEKDTDFLYVWFLAQRKEYKAIDGLLEAKSFILNLSHSLNLPIYMETTEERLVPIYQRIGFEFYDYQEDASANLKVWFGRFA